MGSTTRCSPIFRRCPPIFCRCLKTLVIVSGVLPEKEKPGRLMSARLKSGCPTLLLLRGWKATTVVLPLEVKNIQHQERVNVHQYHMTADDRVLTVRWRRRQLRFEILGAPLHAFAQAGRQGPADT